MKNILFIYLILISFISGLSAQSLLPADTLKYRLWQQTRLYPQEKIYTLTDRPVYVTGDTIWFSTHVVNSISHCPERLSRYAYAELYKEDSLIYRAKVQGDTLGVMAGYIPLERGLSEGSYQLRTYTRYSAYQKESSVFTRPIFLISSLPQEILSGNSSVNTSEAISDICPDTADSVDYQVRFFPEGGNCVAGALCRFAFEAVNAIGNAEEIKGYIINSRKDTLLSIHTLHDGMGEFAFMPQSGETYEAICSNKEGVKKTFRLPAAQTGCRSLHIITTHKAFHVSLVSNDSSYTATDSRLQLLVLQRSLPIYVDAWDGKLKSFPVQAFREGTLHFILLDKGRIISERQAFVFPHEGGTECIVTANAGSYKKRSPVRLEFMLQNASGQVPEGIASVSVTDNRDGLPDSCFTIQTGLLSTPDLQGEINDPGWYFRHSQTKEGRQAMDVLMLVRGWRRYDIEPALQGNFREPEVLPEVSLQVSGTVLNRKREGVENCKVTLAAPGTSVLEQLTTAEGGRFVFNGFEAPEGIRYVVSARTDKGKENVHIVFDADSLLADPVAPFPQYAIKPGQWYEYKEKVIDKITQEQGMRHIYLGDVTIKAKKKKRYDTEFERFASKVIDEERISQSGLPNLAVLLRALAGITVGGSGARNGIWNYLLVFDGMPVYAEDHEMEMYLLSSFPVENIGQIDILKGSVCSGFFNGKNNMIIAVTTKQGDRGGAYFKKTNTGYVTPLGYQQPVEFYNPVYKTKKQYLADVSDQRTLLYWQPRLYLKDGKATADFYTSDSDSSFSVVVEGVTLQGETFRACLNFY